MAEPIDQRAVKLNNLLLGKDAKMGPEGVLTKN
jgi:hypothetical protein